MFDLNVFSYRLKQLRLSKDFSQDELACILGIDLSFYIQLETSSAEPSVDIIAKLSSLFSISADYLIGRSNTP